jgi:hypothetical protein
MTAAHLGCFQGNRKWRRKKEYLFTELWKKLELYYLALGSKCRLKSLADLEKEKGRVRDATRDVLSRWQQDDPTDEMVAFCVPLAEHFLNTFGDHFPCMSAGVWVFFFVM